MHNEALSVKRNSNNILITCSQHCSVFDFFSFKTEIVLWFTRAGEEGPMTQLLNTSSNYTKLCPVIADKQKWLAAYDWNIDKQAIGLHESISNNYQ